MSVHVIVCPSDDLSVQVGGMGDTVILWDYGNIYGTHTQGENELIIDFIAIDNRL